MGLLTDDGAGALAILGGAMAQGNFGGGLLGATQFLDQQKQQAVHNQLIAAQVANLASEAEMRKAQMAKMNEGLAFLHSALGGGNAQPAYQPGQLGSGSMGVVPNDNPTAPAAPRASGLSAMTPEQVALAKVYGFDLLEPWKVAKQGFEQKPGTFRVDASTNQMKYVPDPTKGVDFQGGRVSALPGFNDFTTGQTLATEAPKTLLSSAANVNLRKNADGTESPVSSLAENPTLQNVLGALTGVRMNVGAPTQPAAPAAPVAAPAPARATPVAAQPGVTGSYDLNDPALMGAINDIKDPQERANALAALKQQQGGIRYGKTTAQETQDAANKEYTVATAKDTAEARKGIMNAAFVAPSNIARYQQIGQLLDGVDGGKFTPMGVEIASAANSLGIKLDPKLGNKQAAMAIANQAALELRNPAGGAGMPGALSDGDRKFLASMTPGIAQSAEGRKQIISSYIALQQRNQQVATFARKYEDKYGRLDNKFFDQLQSWSNANPLFGSK